MKTARQKVEQPIVDGKGREVVPIKVEDSPAFARACVAVMRDVYDEDLSRYLKHKGFWVPKDVPALARARLGQAHERQGRSAEGTP